MARRAQRKSTNKRTEKKTARKENVKGLQRAGPQHIKKPSLSRARFCARRSLQRPFRLGKPFVSTALPPVRAQAALRHFSEVESKRDDLHHFGPRLSAIS